MFDRFFMTLELPREPYEPVNHWNHSRSIEIDIARYKTLADCLRIVILYKRKVELEAQLVQSIIQMANRTGLTASLSGGETDVDESRFDTPNNSEYSGYSPVSSESAGSPDRPLRFLGTVRNSLFNNVVSDSDAEEEVSERRISAAEMNTW